MAMCLSTCPCCVHAGKGIHVGAKPANRGGRAGKIWTLEEGLMG